MMTVKVTQRFERSYKMCGVFQMEMLYIPFVAASCLVLVLYLFQGSSDGSDAPTSKQPNYFVVFCLGLILTYAIMYLFRGGTDDSLNNLMKEIDVGEPKF